ncbi:MAG TPA: Holliday junction resolvase RuvX [Alphaproteobacteria bacterium]
MTTDDLRAFAALLPAGGALLGLDPGTKSIGVAASDARRVVASPVATLARARFADTAEAVERLCRERDVAGLVVGLAVNMDGSEGPRAQSARALAANLEARLGLPVLLWDERLSTSAVTRTLIEADLSRRRRRQVIDKLAATYILQGALDALARV